MKKNQNLLFSTNFKILAAESLRSDKLKRHLKTLHKYSKKSSEFFRETEDVAQQFPNTYEYAEGINFQEKSAWSLSSKWIILELKINASLIDVIIPSNLECLLHFVKLWEVNIGRLKCLLNSSPRWLSRGKTFKLVYKLRNEIGIFRVRKIISMRSNLTFNSC